MGLPSVQETQSIVGRLCKQNNVKALENVFLLPAQK